MMWPSMGTVLAAVLAVHAGAEANAQFLTPDELATAVDGRVDQLAPYRAMLNDPDPARGRAVMEIMLASGESALERTEIEAGLLSTDGMMQRMAAEGVLAQGMPLTVALNGSEQADWAAFDAAMKRYLEAATTPGGIAYVNVPYGEFDAERGCWVRVRQSNFCAVAINGDGIFVTLAHFQARLGYGPDGLLSGAGTVTGFDPSLAATLKILE